jgi:hypothetical protein
MKRMDAEKSPSPAPLPSPFLASPSPSKPEPFPHPPTHVPYPPSHLLEVSQGGAHDLHELPAALALRAAAGSGALLDPGAIADLSCGRSNNREGGCSRHSVSEKQRAAGGEGAGSRRRRRTQNTLLNTPSHRAAAEPVHVELPCASKHSLQEIKLQVKPEGMHMIRRGRRTRWVRWDDTGNDAGDEGSADCHRPRA